MKLTYKDSLGKLCECEVRYYDLIEKEDFLQSDNVAFSIKGSRYLSAVDLPEDIVTKNMIAYPLYAYIHGNIALERSPSCNFDSGRVGTLFIKPNTPTSEIDFALEYNSNVINGQVYSVFVESEDCWYTYNPAEDIDTFVKSAIDSNATEIDFHY